ncbi:MAG: hypothetical protein GX591_14990 [Planctomycetes bacterium]|nr:hypothetical protein [Planctomycetota bacterium]
MRHSRPPTTAPRPGGVGALLVVLAVAVLAPTAGVLWFMGQAVRNERLAVRQRLTEAYRRDAEAIRVQLADYWGEKVDALEGADASASPPAVFDALARGGLCDSAQVYGEAGRVLYPRVVGWSPPPSRPAMWSQAEHLEHQANRPEAAAAAYAALAAQSRDPDFAAEALLARARCLAKAGRAREAVAILTGPLAEPLYADATGPWGRLIVPNAQLLALELMDAGADAAGVRRTLEGLWRGLDRYDGPAMPSAQRLFLMDRLAAGPWGASAFPTHQAERLACDLVATGDVPPAGGALHATRVGGLWRLARADRRVAMLLREDRLVADMQALIDAAAPPAGAAVRLVRPGAAPGEALLTLEIAEPAPSWRLAVVLTGDDPFAAAAGRQVALYVWTGILLVALIVALAAVVARFVARQMRLTRLKNTLVATVSHELKTPLATMRALVDTLLAGRVSERQQVTEYLQMLARENQRLSRLIDNFLTFSRMERNKRAFTFEPIEPEAVVDAALAAMAERLSSRGCTVETNVDGELPAVVADGDALVIVLTNLLDNAWKYTGEDKRIGLRAWAADGHLHLAVSDNGVGLSRRSARRIFERFYQVDRRLIRPAGGVGLGLSIVKFIIAAHGGTIDVASHLGHGSTFTVRLPVAGPAEAGDLGR